MSVWKRLFLSIIAVSIFFYLNFNDYYVSASFNNLLNFSLLIFFTLGFIHLINITDGINGLVLSLFIYTCCYYILKGYENYEIFYQNFLILNIITLLIFLIPNFFGKCFLGNTGSYLIAIIISILYLELYKISILEYSDILIIFLIPLVDGLRVSFNRIINKTNPFIGDLSHIHHKIRGYFVLTLIYFALVFIPSIFNFFYKDFTILIAIISVILFFIFFPLLKKIKND